jgi:hypothetical protein
MECLQKSLRGLARGSETSQVLSLYINLVKSRK